MRDMRNGDGGVFTIDLIAGYGIFVVMLAAAFCVATSVISRSLTEDYAGELRPLAKEASDMLILNLDSPPGWYTTPSLTGEVKSIGLSDGRPGILSADKINALGLFNGSELIRHLGMDDPDRDYGIRIEVRTDDGSLSVAAGYKAEGAADVYKCTRIVAIRCADGGERSGKLVVYLWRRYEGTAGTYR